MLPYPQHLAAALYLEACLRREDEFALPEKEAPFKTKFDIFIAILKWQDINETNRENKE